MTAFLPHFHPSSVVCCDSKTCAYEMRAREVDSISSPSDCLVAGSVIPAGTCPKCGALAYLLPDVTGLEIGDDVGSIVYEGNEFSIISVKGAEIHFMVESSFLEQDVGPIYNPYTGAKLTGEDVDPDWEAVS